MKTIQKVLLVFIALYILLCQTELYTQDAGSFTNYYYYEGKPHYINFSENEIFITINKNVTKEKLLRLIVKYSELVPEKNYNYSIGYSFVKLNRNYNNEEIKLLTDRLRNEDGIDDAVPVFYENEKGARYGLQSEMIVQFKSSLSNSAIQRYLKEQKLEILRKIDLKGGETYLLKIKDDKFPLDKVNEVYFSGMVNYTDPSFIIKGAMLEQPNDPYFTSQWALRNTGSNVPGGVTGVAGCDMRVDSAWNITSGNPNIIIAVNDTGIDTSHTDMAANLLPGYDVFYNIPSASSIYHHGTRVSGIIGAIKNNNLDIAGIASNCKVLPIKIIDSLGNLSSAVSALGIIYAYQHGAWVINNSYEGSAISAMDNAINDASLLGRNGKGTLCLFASGNTEGQLYGLQAVNKTIVVVGGISPCNQRKSPTSCDNETTWGSTYGSNLYAVAPCVKIYTTNINGGVTLFNGTSSACPNATGVAALVLSVDTNLTWKSLKERIGNSSEKAGNYVYNGIGPDTLGKWNNQMGYGKVNAYNALRYTIQKKVIQHTPLNFTEQITGNYQINCSLTPNGYPFIPSEIKLLWSKDNINISDSALMTNTGGSNYTSNIPSTGSGIYRYYIKVKDANNIFYKAPYFAPSGLYEFLASPDTVKPSINHSPKQIVLKAFWPDTLRAIVKDNYGIDSVWVKWKKNFNGNEKIFRLNKTYDSIFVSVFNSVQNEININDTIYYKIYAKDISITGNRDSTAMYSLVVLSKYSIVIGNYSTGTSYYPFATSSTDARTDMLYKSTEIKSIGGTSGYLTKAGFKIKTCSPCTVSNLSIKMQNSTDTNFTGYINTNWTTVFNGTKEITDTGWIYFDFSDPFLYDTTKNLLVEVCYSNPHPSTGINYVMGFSNTGGYKMWARTFPSGGCGITGGSANGNRASISLYFDLTLIVTNEINGNQISEYSLSQNYPNPFNPITKIQYNISKKGLVTIKIYDILGRELTVLVNEVKQAGSYVVDFNASSYSSGVYYYKIVTEDFTDVKKMVLIK